MIQNGPTIIKPKLLDTLYATVSVGASETGYSDYWDLIDVSAFALEYKVACTGTPNIKIQVQQSSDATNWFTPDTYADIVPSVTDKNQHGCLLSPIPVRYLRLVITEQTESETDSVVILKVSAQKRFSS